LLSQAPLTPTQRPLVFLADEDYPPLSYVEDGAVTGIDVEIALCRRGRIDLIRIRACVVRKADHGVGVEWCEPLPLAVDELVEYATDVMTPPSRATGSAMGAAR